MNLKFCFSVRCPRHWHVRFHTHEALELVYYVDGTGGSTIGEKRYDLRRNSFTVIPKGVPHDQENLTEMTSICLGLSGSDLEPFAGAWFDAGGILGQAARTLIRENKSQKAGHDWICQGLLLEIKGLVHRIASEAADRPRKETLVDKAMEIIQHREGALSVAELAEQLYVSKDYLRHLFHEMTDQSPIRHIIQTRIEKARDLLGRSDLGIKEVAEQCGFESVYYFSRLFRKETGFAPSGYRTTKRS